MQHLDDDAAEIAHPPPSPSTTALSTPPSTLSPLPPLTPLPPLPPPPLTLTHPRVLNGKPASRPAAAGSPCSPGSSRLPRQRRRQREPRPPPLFIPPPPLPHRRPHHPHPHSPSAPSLTLTLYPPPSPLHPSPPSPPSSPSTTFPAHDATGDGRFLRTAQAAAKSIRSKRGEKSLSTSEAEARQRRIEAFRSQRCSRRRSPVCGHAPPPSTHHHTSLHSPPSTTLHPLQKVIGDLSEGNGADPAALGATCERSATGRPFRYTAAPKPQPQPQPKPHSQAASTPTPTPHPLPSPLPHPHHPPLHPPPLLQAQLDATTAELSESNAALTAALHASGGDACGTRQHSAAQQLW